MTAEAVEGMKPGSVIVDLAGETGGNCELTEPGQIVVKHNVTIASPLNIASSMPEHASRALRAQRAVAGRLLLETPRVRTLAAKLDCRGRDHRRRMHHARRPDRP